MARKRVRAQVQEPPTLEAPQCPYAAVNAVRKRAVALAAGASPRVFPVYGEPAHIAMRELAAGRLRVQRERR